MENLVLQTIRAGYNNTIILHDISLTVAPQEILVLMGQSGSGKTTLLKTILGVLKPLYGKIFLHGHDMTAIPIEMRDIGYLPQDYGLFPHLTVAQNIAYGLQVRGISQQEQKDSVKKLLEQMRLQGFENRSIRELSSGQQQRVGLARALAIKPKLLLLDEPMTNIDQITKLEVAQELKKVFGSLQIPVIIVTHNYEDAKFLGKRIAILINGVLEQIGTYQELLRNPKNEMVKKLLVPFFEH